MVSRNGHGQFFVTCIENAVHKCHEVGALADFVLDKTAIEFVQHLLWTDYAVAAVFMNHLGVIGNLLFEKDGNHGRGNSVTRNIGNKETHCVLVDLKNVVKIPPNALAGHISRKETDAPNTGHCVGKQTPLNLCGRLHVKEMLLILTLNDADLVLHHLLQAAGILPELFGLAFHGFFQFVRVIDQRLPGIAKIELCIHAGPEFRCKRRLEEKIICPLLERCNLFISIRNHGQYYYGYVFQLFVAAYLTKDIEAVSSGHFQI